MSRRISIDDNLELHICLNPGKPVFWALGPWVSVAPVEGGMSNNSLCATLTLSFMAYNIFSDLI